MIMMQQQLAHEQQLSINLKQSQLFLNLSPEHVAFRNQNEKGSFGN